MVNTAVKRYIAWTQERVWTDALLAFGLPVLATFIVGSFVAQRFTGDAWSFAQALAVWGGRLAAHANESNSALEALTYGTPLILAGAAVLFGTRAGLLNIGVEGQLYLGAFTMAILGQQTSFTGVVASVSQATLAFLIAMALPGSVAGLCGWLRLRFSVHEVPSTLFTSFIAIGLINYALTLPPIRDPDMVPQTREVINALAWEPTFAPVKAAAVTVACLAALVFVDRRTTLGLLARARADNSEAFERLGLRERNVLLPMMFLSGSISGLVGIMRVVTLDHRFVHDFSPGYGYIGIGLAFAARSSYTRLLLIGIGCGIIQVVGISLQQLGVASEFAPFLQGTLICLVIIAGRRRAK